MRAASHLRILLRAESLIAEAKLRGVARRTGLMAGAGVIVLFGLAMLNVAGFFALLPLWGPAWAGFAVAVVDLIIAVAVALVGLSSRQSAEVKAAETLRDTAMEGLEADIRGMAAGAAVPLVAAIVRSFRRGKS